MKILAPAKLNLCLDIIKKSPEGYHEIWTIFHALENLSDEVEIYETKEGDNLSIEQGTPNKTPNRLPKTEENLAYRALKVLKSSQKIDKNAQIHIKKKIPIAAGLGGASSDAAAVLKGLNELWDLGLSNYELMKIGAELGMDVPFFILGGTALGTHFGEKVTPLRPIKNINFNLLEESDWPASPAAGEQKTASMYSMIDLSKCDENIEKTNAMLRAIETEGAEEIVKNLHNDFESLYSLKEGQHLSGSGPAVFTAEITH